MAMALPIRKNFIISIHIPSPVGWLNSPYFLFTPDPVIALHSVDIGMLEEGISEMRGMRNGGGVVQPFEDMESKLQIGKQGGKVLSPVAQEGTVGSGKQFLLTIQNNCCVAC